MRDLLAISRWRAETVTPTFACCPDDLQTDATDQPSTRPRWRKVIYADTRSPMEESTRIEHLIWWNELGPDGLVKWIKLRENFARAVDPAVSSIYLKNSIIEVQLTQIAIGLEALGFLIAMRDDGSTETQANALSFKQRLIRIAQDVPGVLPFASDTWAQTMSTAYNSLKHVNRPTQQLPIVANSWREGTLLFGHGLQLSWGLTTISLSRALHAIATHTRWLRLAASRSPFGQTVDFVGRRFNAIGVWASQDFR